MTVVSDGFYLVSESTKLLGFLSWALFRDSRPAVQCHISAAAYDTPLKNVILTVNQSEEQKKTYSTFYMGNSLKIYNFANSVPFRWSLQILSGPIDICPSKYHHLGQRDLWTCPMLNLLTPPKAAMQQCDHLLSECRLSRPLHVCVSEQPGRSWQSLSSFLTGHLLSVSGYYSLNLQR